MGDEEELWDRLPRESRDRVDAELRRRRLIPAMMAIRDALGPSAGLSDIYAATAERGRWLFERGQVEPEPIVEVSDLLARAQQQPSRVAAIEAVWDGDTQGWMVSLLAIIERPSQHHGRFDQLALAVFRPPLFGTLDGSRSTDEDSAAEAAPAGHGTPGSPGSGQR